MSKHTKGEWDLADNGMDDKHQFSVVAYNSDGCRLIADTYLNRKNKEESEANAKLIAAAPDLLDALQSAYKCSGEKGKLTIPVLDKMLEAILNATK